MDTQPHPYIFSINDDYHDKFHPNIIHKKTINLSMKNVPKSCVAFLHTYIHTYIQREDIANQLTSQRFNNIFQFVK